MKQLHLLLYIYSFLFSVKAFSQADSATSRALPEVMVKAYFRDEPLIITPASVSILDSIQLKVHPDNSLVSAMNTVPGVRMEERSPLSYRLSIRGSLLRSPFGVRDVKIYLDDFSLTDAGGNSYINLLDPSAVSRIEVLKGPEGSIYGANTGGVVIITPIPHPTDSLSVGAMAESGSYGYFQSGINFQKIIKDYLLNVSLSYQRSDGYRQNTASRQFTTQVLQHWQYTKRAKLKAYVLFTDLQYQTPGGLTLAQYNADPREARPTAGAIPGSVIQHAAIYNKSIFGGLANDWNISDALRHVIAVSASHTSFINPFLTNYEVRSENNVDVRTYFDWSGGRQRPVKWSWVNGVELQQNISTIDDYGNNKGTRDSVQSFYNFNAGQYFYFSRFSMNIIRRVTLEGAVSLNYNWYQYRTTAPVEAPSATDIKFDLQVMPRIALSVQIINGLAWRASVSRGYSPPTLAEIHPSATVISPNLQAESGWNYETGFRFREKHDLIRFDEVFFYYQLQNAIVVRGDSNGNNYFVNAGGTRQFGFEEQVMIWPVKPRNYGFVRGLQINVSYTYDHFRFRDYQSGASSYAGNYLTGVPPHTLVSNVNMDMPAGFYIFIEHNYTSHIPLNDANSAWATYYNLLQCRVGWKHYFHKSYMLEIYAGVNNILNEKYSLGNDINAAAGRYYNAAMPVNYYGGVRFGFGK